MASCRSKAEPCGLAKLGSEAVWAVFGKIVQCRMILELRAAFLETHKEIFQGLNTPDRDPSGEISETNRIVHVRDVTHLKMS